MEKVKEVLYQKVDNHGTLFNSYYQNFLEKVNDFLGSSISAIQK